MYPEASPAAGGAAGGAAAALLHGTACAFLREAAEMRILQCPHWV